MLSMVGQISAALPSLQYYLFIGFLWRPAKHGAFKATYLYSDYYQLASQITAMPDIPSASAHFSRARFAKTQLRRSGIVRGVPCRNSLQGLTREESRFEMRL